MTCGAEAASRCSGDLAPVFRQGTAGGAGAGAAQHGDGSGSDALDGLMDGCLQLGKDQVQLILVLCLNHPRAQITDAVFEATRVAEHNGGEHSPARRRWLVIITMRFWDGSIPCTL